MEIRSLGATGIGLGQHTSSVTQAALNKSKPHRWHGVQALFLFLLFPPKRSCVRDVHHITRQRVRICLNPENSGSQLVGCNPFGVE